MRKIIFFAAALAAAASLAGCGGKVTIKDETLRLSLGQEHTLSVNAPKSAELTFTSMDPNIAAVDENGVVKAMGNGITVISVRSEKSFANVAVVAGSGVAEYVEENGTIVSSPAPYDVDDALISGESDITALSVSIVGGGTEDVTIAAGRTYDLKITKTPADSSDKIILKISDGSIARVDGNKLTGVSRGKTTLTASAPNGVSTEMVVRVK